MVKRQPRRVRRDCAPFKRYFTNRCQRRRRRQPQRQCRRRRRQRHHQRCRFRSRQCLRRYPSHRESRSGWWFRYRSCQCRRRQGRSHRRPRSPFPYQTPSRPGMRSRQRSRRRECSTCGHLPARRRFRLSRHSETEGGNRGADQEEGLGHVQSPRWMRRPGSAHPNGDAGDPYSALKLNQDPANCRPPPWNQGNHGNEVPITTLRGYVASEYPVSGNACRTRPPAE
jgi:hypothetical protein